MSSHEDAVQVLSQAECWERLATQQVGRLVTHVGDVIDIVPLNYVVDGESIVFRSAAGTKLSELTINHSVVFEADEHDDHNGWSVVVHGRAERLESHDEIVEAEKLPLRPMIQTLKLHFVRVVPEKVTGRSFAFGPELQREDVQEGW